MFFDDLSDVMFEIAKKNLCQCFDVSLYARALWPVFTWSLYQRDFSCYKVLNFFSFLLVEKYFIFFSVGFNPAVCFQRASVHFVIFGCFGVDSIKNWNWNSSQVLISLLTGCAFKYYLYSTFIFFCIYTACLLLTTLLMTNRFPKSKLMLLLFRIKRFQILMWTKWNTLNVIYLF